MYTAQQDDVGIHTAVHQQGAWCMGAAIHWTDGEYINPCRGSLDWLLQIKVEAIHAVFLGQGQLRLHLQEAAGIRMLGCMGRGRAWRPRLMRHGQ